MLTLGTIITFLLSSLFWYLIVFLVIYCFFDFFFPAILELLLSALPPLVACFIFFLVLSKIFGDDKQEESSFSLKSLLASILAPISCFFIFLVIYQEIGYNTLVVYGKWIIICATVCYFLERIYTFISKNK